MKRETSKELAKMIYEDLKSKEGQEEDKYKQQVWNEGLNNIADTARKACVYCHELVELDGKTHREEKIKPYDILWIAKCPKCGGDNYGRIFLEKTIENMNVVWYVNSRWRTKEHAHDIIESEEEYRTNRRYIPPERNMGIGFASVRRPPH